MFACFNNQRKFGPDIFDIWMRLLSAIEGSVLWLGAVHPSAMGNLRREARAHGVSPDRIVFAPRLPGAKDHLARLRLADLFLDTLPYNAHATACDALWAGVPVLTCMGNAFPGGVAASILRATGLPELVTTSLPEYEKLALTLAQNPERLASIRARLICNRNTHPLFDLPGSRAVWRRRWQQCGNEISAENRQRASWSQAGDKVNPTTGQIHTGCADIFRQQQRRR